MTLEQSLELLISTFGLSSNGEIKGRTRVQKLICDLQFEHNIPMHFSFHSYYYGPYSEDLTGLVGDLVDLKILKEEAFEFDSGNTRYDYSLTDEGFRLYNKIAAKLGETSPSLIENLRNAIEALEDVPTPVLIDMAKEASQMESTG